jgi:TM2 domain-containing membrane protein YozV
MNRKYFLATLLLGIVLILNAEERETADPLLAGLLSWSLPGVGQFYAAAYPKGGLFLASYLSLSTAVWIISENYDYKLGYGGIIKFREVKTKEKENLLVYLGLAVAMVRILSTIDAVRETHRGAVFLKKEEKKIEPFLAALLSWYISGFGHFYTRSYKKGSLYVLGDIIFKSLGFYLTLKFNAKYQKLHDTYFLWNDSPANSIRGLSDKDKFLVGAYIISWLAFRVVNTIDAFFTAKEYNLKESPFLSTPLRFTGNLKKVSLSIIKYF